MTTTGKTTESGTTGTALTLQPYIFFYGRCEEALNFYKNIFGGSYDAMRVGDSPYKGEMGDDNRIMHASFTAPGLNFLCSDGQSDRRIDPEEGNVSLAINASDPKTGERICSALADGGTVKMPLAEAFWGGRFANIVDRFGNDWMITTP